MHTDTSYPFWLPLVVSTVFVLWLSAALLPLLLLLPTLACIAFLMHVQVYNTRTLAKSFWISTYLRSDSPVRKWLSGTILLRWIAAILSIPLAIITYIAIYGYDWVDCISISIGVFLARLAHLQISSPIDKNLAEDLAELAHVRVYDWFAVLLVLCCLALSSVAKGLTMDYAESTSDQLATLTIDTVKHPVRFVQHCVRTLRYSELQLLRVRDINGWPYGWMIYLFFLIPNALPAFGIVTLYSGFDRFLQKGMLRG